MVWEYIGIINILGSYVLNKASVFPLCLFPFTDCLAFNARIIGKVEPLSTNSRKVVANCDTSK